MDVFFFFGGGGVFVLFVGGFAWFVLFCLFSPGFVAVCLLYFESLFLEFGLECYCCWSLLPMFVCLGTIL